MESEIKNILKAFCKKHKGIYCEFQEDILLDIYKIVMEDLETGKRIKSAIYIQALELSRLGVDEELIIILDEMLSKLRGANTNEQID